MGWFSRKSETPPSCAQCGVYFKPHTNELNKQHWPQLCGIHLEEYRKLYLRKEVVVEWAKENWEKLEARALRETESAGKKRVKDYQKNMWGLAQCSNAVRQQSASVQSFFPGGLGLWVQGP